MVYTKHAKHSAENAKSHECNLQHKGLLSELAGCEPCEIVLDEWQENIRKWKNDLWKSLR